MDSITDRTSDFPLSTETINCDCFACLGQSVPVHTYRAHHASRSIDTTSLGDIEAGITRLTIDDDIDRAFSAAWQGMNITTVAQPSTPTAQLGPQAAQLEAAKFDLESIQKRLRKLEVVAITKPSRLVFKTPPTITSESPPSTNALELNPGFEINRFFMRQASILTLLEERLQRFSDFGIPELRMMRDEALRKINGRLELVVTYTEIEWFSQRGRSETMLREAIGPVVSTSE